MKTPFSIWNPSTWSLNSPRPEDLGKARKDGGVSGKLKSSTEYESALEIGTFESNIRLAEDLITPDRRSLNYHYKEFLKDGHLLSLVNTRLNKILSEPFGLYSDSGKLDKKATDLLRRPWFDRFVKLVLDAEFWGFSLIEIPTIGPGGEIEDVFLIPRDNVDQVNGKIYKRSENWYGVGMDFRSGPLVKNLMEVSQGKRYLGLLLQAGKYVIYKKYALSDWSRHSEKFGMPAVVLKTDTTDKARLDKKQAFLENFGSNSWTIVDDGDEIELLETQKTDPYKIYKEAIDAQNNELSKVILGQTGTSDEKAFVGSAEVHERILDDYTLTDLRRIIWEVNYKLIPRLILQGYTQLKGLSFDYEQNRKEEDETKSAGIDPKNPKSPKPEEDDEKKKLSLSPGMERALSLIELYNPSIPNS